MKFPSVFSSLESLVPLGEQGGLFQFRLAEHRGWTMEHPSGLLVAVAIERKEPDIAWFEQVSLWLASTTAGLDDSLQISDEGIWLVRRLAPSTEASELETSLSQMVSIARWFARLGDFSHEVGSCLFSEIPA